MIVTSPGPVTDRITLLGREESCLYLIDGQSESAIFGGGMAYVAFDLESQFKDLGIDESKISRIFIHHSHFDHVGAVPWLKKRLPQAKVTASARARDLLADPKVAETIRAYNLGLIEAKGLGDRMGELALDDGVVVEETPADGEVLLLGDLSLQCLAVPGHSSCSMAVYIPEIKTLSASDAGGIPYGDSVFVSANSNFDLYQDSLAKMSRLDAEVVLFEHYGARTGSDGRTFITRSMEEARQTRAILEQIYARTRDEEQTAAEATLLFHNQSDGYFLPEEIMNMVVRQMVRFIAKKHAGLK